jgi:hypothetical protein
MERSHELKALRHKGDDCGTVGAAPENALPTDGQGRRHCSGPASDSLAASTDTQRTWLQYTALPLATHGQGTETSVRSNPETRRRISCRNTAAFIGWAELATSPSRCAASAAELAGDNTNNTASRECVPIR